MRARLKERVKPSRYMHCSGRFSNGRTTLARIYGANENDAAVAGLLHDWDKALPASELKRIAKKHHLAPKTVRKSMPGVLHALLPPLVPFARNFPSFPTRMLQSNRTSYLRRCGHE